MENSFQLDIIKTAVIIFDSETLKVHAFNKAATKNLRVKKDTSFFEIWPLISKEKLFKRLEKGREFTYFTEAKPENAPNFPFEVHFKFIEYENKKWILAEGVDLSRLKERELMLKSYLKLIKEQNQKNEGLLLNILPEKVMKELMERGSTEPELFVNVSIMFLDFVNFTKMPISRKPKLLFAELNDLFTSFDEITEKNDCERIKTIGDAYLAVCGLPKPNENHALNIVDTAIEIIDYLKLRNQSSSVQWECRIGIHTGNVIGGVVGIKKYIYDLFGDAMNTASRMQSLSEPMKINVSLSTSKLINEKYSLIPRGKLPVKGKHLMEMYFIDSEKN